MLLRRLSKRSHVHDGQIDRWSWSFSRDLDKKTQTSNNGYALEDSFRRAGIVGGASEFVPDHRHSLIQCDCCKVGSMIAATHQRPPLLVPFATSRARKNHTNVLPRTCRSVTFTHSPPRARYSIAFQFLRTCISLICYSNNNARITILKETS